MNFIATIIICFASPYIQYVIAKSVGLELDSSEYYFFEDPVLAFYFTLIFVDYIAMRLLKVFRVRILTCQLLVVFWALIVSHCSALIAVSLIDLVNYPSRTFYIDEYVTVLYPAIMMLLHASQLFLLIVACGSGIQSARN